MNELQRKFKIMSEIAIALQSKGLIASVTIFPEFCNMDVQDNKSSYVIANLYSREVTEQELLDWWDTIENGPKAE